MLSLFGSVLWTMYTVLQYNTVLQQDGQLLQPSIIYNVEIAEYRGSGAAVSGSLQLTCSSRGSSIGHVSPPFYSIKSINKTNILKNSLMSLLLTTGGLTSHGDQSRWLHFLS